MLKVFLILSISFISFHALGQGKKTQVLVYGNSEASWAAAIQSSKSGVNTLWITDSKIVGDKFIGSDNIQVIDNNGLDAGLWVEVLQKVSRAKMLTDSMLNHTKRSINPRLVQNAFTAFVDSATNLTVLYNVNVKQIKKSGDRWKVDLSTNQSIKVNAIVDGSEGATLMKLLQNEDRVKPENVAKED